jgi:hypothetical protein
MWISGYFKFSSVNLLQIKNPYYFAGDTGLAAGVLSLGLEVF